MRFLLPTHTSPPDRTVTDRQIAEAKKLAAECEALKDGLVAKANGALVKLKGGKIYGTGEQES